MSDASPPASSKNNAFVTKTTLKTAPTEMPPASRIALFVVSLATGLSLIGDSTLYTVLPTHTSEAGISVASLGILLSANRFIRLLLNSPTGIAYDRWSHRRLFIAALFIGAVSTALYAFAAGFWPLLLGRLLWGLAWSGIWIGGNAIVMETVGTEQRGRWIGFYHASFFLGAAAGALLGGWMTDLIGYHPAMAVGATLTFVGTAVAWLFLPETNRLEKNLPVLPAVRDKSANGSDWRRPMELASVAALLAVNRIVIAGILYATLGLFLLEQLGDAVPVAGQPVGVATLTGMGLGFSTLAGMFFAPVAGGISDRAANRWQVAAAGLLPGVAGFALLAAGSPAAILFGLFLASLSSGSNQSLSTALLADLTRQTRHGRSLGLLFTVGDLASAVGPLLAYFLFPLVGLNAIYATAAGLLALMFFIALPWATRVNRPR
jgi:MFS family permease